MDGTLTEPTPEEAERFLEPVDFDHRIVGLRMAAMGGSNPTDIFGLVEAARFIHVGEYEIALRDNHSTVGYVDLNALASWIAEVIGDAALADAVVRRAGEGEFYGNVAMRVKELLMDRVAQCERVLAAAHAEVVAG